MGWPSQIKEDVLVACGRRCCLCHTFCGPKMELHHIQLQSEGGENSFDNCIPLCFNCHADMSSYDHKHKKGTKYTTTELKRRRDDWYEKVRISGTNVGSEEFRGLDRSTYQRLRSIISWNATILFLKEHDFGGSFRMSRLKELSNFVYECEDPSFEFMNADLEGLRMNLLISIRTFLSNISVKTFTNFCEEHDFIQSVPSEWRYEKPELHAEAVEMLNQGATEIAERYDDFVKMARRILTI